jgi:hypothetical protein
MNIYLYNFEKLFFLNILNVYELQQEISKKRAESLLLFLEEKINRLKTLGWSDDQFTMC